MEWKYECEAGTSPASSSSFGMLLLLRAIQGLEAPERGERVVSMFDVRARKTMQRSSKTQTRPLF